MKKFASLILSAAMLIACSIVISPASALETKSNSELLTAVQPLLDAEEQYYDINSISISDITSEKENNITYYTFLLTLNMVLKIDSVSENVYVSSLMKALNSNANISRTVSVNDMAGIANLLRSHPSFGNIVEEVSSDVSLMSVEAGSESNALELVPISSLEQSTALRAAESIVADINEFATYVGYSSDFNFVIRVGYNADDAIVSVEGQGVDDFFPLEDFYPMTQSEIQSAVADDIVGYIERAAENVVKETVSPTRGNTSFTYYRTDARDYTKKWTSTVSTAKACGHYDKNGNPEMPKQNMSLWNPDYTGYCHSDCANFVSQAMIAGGVPTDATWKTGKDAFTKCTYQHEYFYETKEWWESVSISTCNAGGIIYMVNSSGNQYHAMLCVLNDGSNKKWSAHTSDKKEATYTSDKTFGSASVEYYRFTKVSPAH